MKATTRQASARNRRIARRMARRRHDRTIAKRLHKMIRTSTTSKSSFISYYDPLAEFKYWMKAEETGDDTEYCEYMFWKHLTDAEESGDDMDCCEYMS